MTKRPQITLAMIEGAYDVLMEAAVPDFICEKCRRPVFMLIRHGGPIICTDCKETADHP